MKGIGQRLSRNMSVGSSVFSEEASPTLWTFDAGEDLEDDSTRVIWKASQPQDPVLNRLMEDAYIPRKSQRVSQIKAWTPSPNSCALLASTSSTSTTCAAERTSRAHRTLRRRASSTAPLQETSTSTRPETSLDKDIQRLLALLPIVSKQVDDNAIREHESFKEKRRKRKKAARLLATGSSVTKKHRNPTDIKGKQRVADENREEEEVTAVEQLPAGKGAESDRSSLQSEVTGRASRTSQNMSPPSFVPLRRAWSSDGSFSNSSANQHDPSASTLSKGEGSAEELYFTPSSFIATSTPRPLSATGSTGTIDEPQAEKLVKELDDDPTAKTGSASGPSNTTDSRVLSHSVTPSGRNHTLHIDPTPTPPKIDSRTPTLQVLVSRGQPHPKSNGPPVLGMRRLPNSQAYPLSQNRPLPVKRDKFKVPFARPNLELDNQKHDSNRVSTAGAKSQHTSQTKSSASSASSTFTRESTTTSQAGFVRASSASSSSSTSQSTKEKPSKVNDGRSSPPPADADSSVDYDMDIDPEELEKVCSAYD